MVDMNTAPAVSSADLNQLLQRLLDLLERHESLDEVREWLNFQLDAIGAARFGPLGAP
jgi:hypothetical protein